MRCEAQSDNPGDGNFRVNLRFQPMLVGWNLGLTRKFPASQIQQLINLWCWGILFSSTMITFDRPYNIMNEDRRSQLVTSSLPACKVTYYEYIYCLLARLDGLGIACVNLRFSVSRMNIEISNPWWKWGKNPVIMCLVIILIVKEVCLYLMLWIGYAYKCALWGFHYIDNLSCEIRFAFCVPYSAE